MPSDLTLARESLRVALATFQEALAALGGVLLLLGAAGCLALSGVLAAALGGQNAHRSE